MGTFLYYIIALFSDLYGSTILRIVKGGVFAKYSFTTLQISAKTGRPILSECTFLIHSAFSTLIVCNNAILLA
ncbi:hypothetical protein NUSPORA_01158 [Nucleospora cyclopteri]